MLTKREIQILTYLLSKKDWVTSEQISVHFGLNKKTIQQELKIISEVLDGKVAIAISKSKGYRLESLTAEANDFIRDQMMRYGGRSSLGLKPSALILYFLFLSSYVTMQTLADTFYMSKTAVSLELSTVKRWVDRCKGIELEVSNKNGIKVYATEIRKRHYCAKFAVVDVFASMPLEREITDTYEHYLGSMAKILTRAFNQYQYQATGEEYNKICRFIASSVLRSRMGYLRAEETAGDEISPLIGMISEQIKETLEYQLTITEQEDIQKLLAESSVLQVGGETDLKITEQLMEYEVSIGNILSIPKDAVFADREMVVQHIWKMHMRNITGNIALNHYNEDIVIQYPLEVHLNYRFFPSCFGIEINKEASFVALFMATALNRFRRSLSVLLVSNQNLSIIEQIKHVLSQSMSCFISRIDVQPVYQFKENSCMHEKYDVLLTTDQETLFIEPSFYLIKSILTQQSISHLNEMLSKKTVMIAAENSRIVKEKYFHEMELDSKETCEELNQKIKSARDPSVSYHTLGNDYLYIGRVSPDAEIRIERYHLGYSIPFLNKKIRRVLFVQFSQGSAGIFDFFHVVSEIIRESI